LLQDIVAPLCGVAKVEPGILDAMIDACISTASPAQVSYEMLGMLCDKTSEHIRQEISRAKKDDSITHPPLSRFGGHRTPHIPSSKIVP
jgi:hypothetical protein